MLTQLQAPIALQTPKGKAWAVALVDNGPHDLLWIAFVHESGECWTFNNEEVRQEHDDADEMDHHPSVAFIPEHKEQNDSFRADLLALLLTSPNRTYH